MQDTLDRLMERVEELQINTGTAAQIQRLQLVGASFKQIEKVVHRDPVLASRLLKVANSSFYGAPRKISELRDALVRIGMVSTRDLAWALAVHALGARASEHGPRLQEHALRVSTATQLMCRGMRGIRPSDAFVVSLLHDLGAQLLLEVEPERYIPMLERYGFDDLMLYAMEKKTFGADHATLAQLVMEKWDLPEHLCRAVGAHHKVRALNRGERDPVLALPAIIFLAEELERLCAQGVEPDECALHLVRHSVNQIVGIQEERFRIAAKVLEDEVAAVRQMVA